MFNNVERHSVIQASYTLLQRCLHLPTLTSPPTPLTSETTSDEFDSQVLNIFLSIFRGFWEHFSIQKCGI